MGARARSALFALAAAAATVATALAFPSAPKFYADDPLAREPETQDASGAQSADVGLMYDLGYNLFVTAQIEPSNVRAVNVNTIDEVPDSSWFTNRILGRRPTPDDLERGPNSGPPPNPERWTIVREKSAGYAPGFTARDANGETWFVSFDAPSNPEGATAAIVIATKLFWALGYNQVETFITHVDPNSIVLDPKATMKRPNGKRTPMTRDDLDSILRRAARSSNGSYRAAAGRLLPGKILGPFRYDGTRSDDPNDVVDHRHRRELRALRVFGAWTNLTDMKAGNTLDALVPANGHQVVRHYLQDVGSTFGMGANGPHDWDEGFEYFYEGRSSGRRLLTFGFALSPWQTARYTLYPSIGRFESDAFDPLTWRPHAPTAAYMEMRLDDAFWAARRVAAFDDAVIERIVHTGQFSDPAAERHLAAVLEQRRDKIARAYLTPITPLVNGRLDADGRFTCGNAAVDAGVAAAPSGYRARWAEFDNVTGERRPIGDARGSACAMQAPASLPPTIGAIVDVDVEAAQGPSAWQQPVRFYFRRAASGWTLVGLEREAPPLSTAAIDGGGTHR